MDCPECKGTGLIDVHCDMDWRDCEDGPGLHFHVEPCPYCGGIRKVRRAEIW